MPLYLVRHAKAGNRSTWTEDDHIRPLSEAGRAQANALAQLLVRLSPTALLSSPYLRCIQTLEPLGELCGLPVVVESRLEEESPLERALASIEDAPDNAVLCSHGDVIPDVINGLFRRGMNMTEAPPPPKKGSVFVLHRVDGAIVRAEYWEAPDV
jgi:broad specificity phosphatase PhoE